MSSSGRFYYVRDGKAKESRRNDLQYSVITKFLKLGSWGEKLIYFMFLKLKAQDRTALSFRPTGGLVVDGIVVNRMLLEKVI